MAAQNFLLTISAGQTASTIVLALDNAPSISVWIGAPAGLTETVKLQTRRPWGPTPQPWYDQQTNNVDIVLTAGKALQVTVLSGVEWRLNASVAVSADRSFDVVVDRIVGQPGLP